MHSAFGPIKSEGQFEIGHGKQIKYVEIYNADFADWWFDVTFYPENDTSFFESFKNENWLEEMTIDSDHGTTVMTVIENSRIYQALFNHQGKLINENSISIEK